ncbi:SPW repeat protein [Streptomyces sp. NPDC048324]|uniref:SPW repeat protein n=1 Tax=Streptomyces sp. NPDC048324 TaxID=3157205 RepID=UPI00344843DB
MGWAAAGIGAWAIVAPWVVQNASATTGAIVSNTITGAVAVILGLATTARRAVAPDPFAGRTLRRLRRLTGARVGDAFLSSRGRMANTCGDRNRRSGNDLPCWIPAQCKETYASQHEESCEDRHSRYEYSAARPRGDRRLQRGAGDVLRDDGER